MTIKKNSQEELIINKCLIIDDNFYEVKDIIFNLNNQAISTDYRKDVLDMGVEIDPNIQLVILDLYMSESQDSFSNALESVAFLNEHIKGPFFLLIWTKHKDKFEKFSEILCEKYSNYENFPLDIEMLSATKITGQQDSVVINKTVDDIIQYIRSIKGKYTNIFYYLKLTKIFQKQSTMFWRIFKSDSLDNKKNPNEFSKYYEKVLGQAFNSFDKSFNYEKSGKGFLNIHAKFLEHELTVNRIDYQSEHDELDNKFKKEINSRLLIHNFYDSKPEEGLPGLIYKESEEEASKNQERIEEFFSITNLNKVKLSPAESLKYNYFKLGTLLGKGQKDKDHLVELLQTPINLEIKNDSKILDHFKEIEVELPLDTSTLGQVLENILRLKIEVGKLIITPYCDFAQKKKKDVLYLPILIVEDDFKNKNKLFKPNVNFLDLHNGKYIAYIVSMYNVCNVEKLGHQMYSFYLSKEYVNEIQINVANNISRIGTTILDYRKEEVEG